MRAGSYQSTLDRTDQCPVTNTNPRIIMVFWFYDDMTCFDLHSALPLSVSNWFYSPCVFGSFVPGQIMHICRDTETITSSR